MAGRQQSVFVTYDIDETGGSLKPSLYRVAKEVLIQGSLTTWEIGEFKIHGFEEAYGVKLKYRSFEDGSERDEIVDTSRYAQNIQIFEGSLPKEYQELIKRSAA